MVGTASWGPVNIVQGPFGDITSAAATYGQFSAALFATDPYDLMRGVMQSLGEAQTDLSLNIYTNRISDGTDAAATIILKDTTTGTAINGITLPAKYTGIGGNTIKVIIAASGASNAYNVTVVAALGGQSIVETTPIF